MPEPRCAIRGDPARRRRKLRRAVFLRATKAAELVAEEPLDGVNVGRLELLTDLPARIRGVPRQVEDLAAASGKAMLADELAQRRPTGRNPSSDVCKSVSPPSLPRCASQEMQDVAVELVWILKE
jgi:hypothetical protein